MINHSISLINDSEHGNDAQAQLAVLKNAVGALQIQDTQAIISMCENLTSHLVALSNVATEDLEEEKDNDENASMTVVHGVSPCQNA